MERADSILPTDKSRALADFLESQKPVIVAILAQSKDLPLIEDLRSTAAEWLNSIIATFRGDCEPCYEWCSAFVNCIRDKGGRIGEIVAAARASRELTLRFCSGRAPDFSDAELRELADASLDFYLAYICDTYGEMERRAFSAELRLRGTMSGLMARAFVTLNGDGMVNFVNAEFCDVTGLSEERLLGIDFTLLCDELAASEIRRGLRQRKAASTRVFDGALLVNKGTRIPLRFRVQPMFDDEGLRSGLAVAMEEVESVDLCNDITLRSKNFELLAEHLGVPCYTIDENFRVVSANEMGLTFVSIGGEDNGVGCCGLHSDSLSGCGDCFRRDIFKAGLPRRTVTQYKISSGAKRWVEIACVPVVERQGKATLITKFLRDITEQKLLQEQYFRQQRTSFTTQLAVAVAHKLRNPLGVIVGFAEMISKGMPPEQLPSAVDRVLRNGIRCKEIVQNLLEFGGDAPGEHVATDINVLIRERVLPLYPASISDRMDLQLTEASLLVEGSSEQLTQVFIHLIDNALRAAKSRVVIKTSFENGIVCVKVRDDGAGIPAEIREHIFDPFFTTHREAGGVGLGLCLSRSVIQEHRGSLTLDEAEQFGACFIVKLPAMEHVESAEPVEAVQAPSPQCGLRVFIAEDETDLLFLLTIALQSAGYAVDCASTGARAVELLHEGRYDVAVIDMLLGDEFGGKELYSVLQATDPDLAKKTIFVTGDTMNYETRRFLGQVRQPYLEKPFMVTDFVAKVDEISGKPPVS